MSRVVSRLFTSVAESQFFLFGLCVAFCSWIEWSFLLPQRLTEARDQRIHLSLLLIFELSFLLSILFRRMFVRLSSKMPSTTTSLGVTGLALNLLVVIAGCCFTFVEKGSNGQCIMIMLAIFVHEWLWTRISRYRLLVLVEVLLAVVLMAACFKAQALVTVKNVHHWSFYLGPLYGVLGGGKLLWSVPSQYGFLPILIPAEIALRFGLSGFDAFGLVVVLMQLGATALLFYLLMLKAKLSPLASAMLTVIACLFLPGWFPELVGPTALPSGTAVRFLPALLTVVLTEKASRNSSTLFGTLAVLVGATAVAWSFESCAYVMVSLCAYAGMRALLDCNARFLATAQSLIPVLALGGGAAIILAYGVLYPSSIDIDGFYEYAMRYVETHGTLPIEFSEMTVFYVFTLAFAYFCARSALRFKQPDALSGVVFFWFLWIVSTYYVARSHPNNMLNLAPWALVAMVASSPKLAPPHVSSFHRASFVVLCALFVNFFLTSVSASHVQVREQFFARLQSRQLWVPVSLPEVPKDVSDFVATNENVTVLRYEDMAQPSPSFSHSGNSVGISPLAHFLTPAGNRHCEYLHRMLEERARLHIVTPPGFPPVFRSCQPSYAVRDLPQIGEWSVMVIEKR